MWALLIPMHLSSSLQSLRLLKLGDLSKYKPVLWFPCLQPSDGSLAVVIGINGVSMVIQVLRGWSQLHLSPAPLLSAQVALSLQFP